MRADRLVATLLFLQTRDQVTTAEVAEELQVSTRTARRDLQALAIAGVPVYSRTGRGGGWSLVGGAKTNLSGLTAMEARTLFLIAGPGSTVTPDAKVALRKLLQALPEPFREEARHAASSVLLDTSDWGLRAPRSPRHLGDLQEAVVRGVQVDLAYSDREGNFSRRSVHPLGLVSKRSTWYLAADTDKGLRTFQVRRVESVEMTDRPVVRPDDFNLGAFWDSVVGHVDEVRDMCVIEVLIESYAVDWLYARFEQCQLVMGESVEDGRIPVQITMPTSHRPEVELAGCCEVLEVLRPPQVRDRIVAIAESMVRLYGPKQHDSHQATE